MDTQLSTLMRGIEEIISEDELKDLLALGRPLRIKAGFDPTAPDLHLGHTVLLNKLKQFQDFGHEIIFLVGDFTASIGDPSGKNVTRKPLDQAKIDENAKTYTDQIFQILDREKTRVVFNSSWMNKFSAADFVTLASRYTVARMLERDDFTKRYREGQGIAIHEFLYPLIQGYDSVALEADIEFGGTDQKFNLLMGRELQRQMGQKPQVVIMTPIIEGLDGVKKMSKSLNNYIAIKDSPIEMFGKIMSVSDELMWRYYDLLSFESAQSIDQLKKEAKEGANPRDIKVALAKEIVGRFHGEEKADQAYEEFVSRFKHGNLPDEVQEQTLAVEKEGMMIGTLLKESGLTKSVAEAMRMIKQGGVRIDGEKIENRELLLKSGETFVVQVGKRRFKKLTLTD
jgi:tyrosyl-tRNA synthetase